MYVYDVWEFYLEHVQDERESALVLLPDPLESLRSDMFICKVNKNRWSSKGVNAECDNRRRLPKQSENSTASRGRCAAAGRTVRESFVEQQINQSWHRRRGEVLNLNFIWLPSPNFRPDRCIALYNSLFAVADTGELWVVPNHCGWRLAKTDFWLLLSLPHAEGLVSRVLYSDGNFRKRRKDLPGRRNIRSAARV